MLAPWCELESATALIPRLGLEGIAWWQRHFPGTVVNGTLVTAPQRDAAELRQFGRRTSGFETLDGAAVDALESDLAGRFPAALYFREEGHLDPRTALGALLARSLALGVTVRFGVDGRSRPHGSDELIDCTGLAARRALPELRGVRGEMLVLRAPEVRLQRPVRLLHPRLPVYVVPRGAGVYMVGASMLESDAGTRISARSLLELLSAACALHPAFGEAEVLETGSAVRAAFPDNLPRLRRIEGALHVNGLYRHGFLLAPALARRAALLLLEGQHSPEVMDEDPRQRRLA
jgi:glycine oxidase